MKEKPKLVAIDGTKLESKHDLVFRGHVFKLETTPFKDGSIEVLYYTDTTAPFGPFQVPVRRVGDARLVKPRWFDFILRRTMDKKVRRAVEDMKQGFHTANAKIERAEKILETVKNAD